VLGPTKAQTLSENPLFRYLLYLSKQFTERQGAPGELLSE